MLGFSMAYSLRISRVFVLTPKISLCYNNSKRYKQNRTESVTSILPIQTPAVYQRYSRYSPLSVLITSKPQTGRGSYCLQPLETKGVNFTAGLATLLGQGELGVLSTARLLFVLVALQGWGQQGQQHCQVRVSNTASLGLVALPSLGQQGQQHCQVRVSSTVRLGLVALSGYGFFSHT